MSSLEYCSLQQKPCVEWVKRHFGDCLCSGKDWASFGFGLASLVCWGVAEIPQIITNFRTKSGHGVSLAFLLTWVVGDVFNTVGCLLDPATLPTQFYTAELYTASTIVLVLQGIYYDKIYKKKNPLIKTEDEAKDMNKNPSNPEPGIPIPTSENGRRREYYYTSARSLAGSGTPPFRSHLRVAKSGPSALQLYDDSSSDDESPAVLASPATQPRQIPRNAVKYGTFVTTSLTMPFLTKGLAIQSMKAANRIALGENGKLVGEILGWVMAGIYMGGRIPQIWLNIKRGSVEGLNPLMFCFALVANVTYVLSIVVRTTKWVKIEPNLPWLLDAVVCVILDILILLQYVYYKYLRRLGAKDEEKMKRNAFK